jgi:PAS domain S-box-containing protein
MAQALRSSEERFAQVFQSAPMLGLISHMADSTIIDVNQEFCRATGYPREQLLGTTPIALGLTQSRERQEALQSLQRDSHLRNHEVALRCKDGSQIDCLLSVDLLDIQGEKLLLSMLADVTERKRAQAALRENDERFRLLLEHAPTALAMFDTDMRYLAVSRRWVEDYRLVGHDVLGKSHYAVFPEISESLKAIHQRALRGEAVSSKEDRFDRADGRVQWLRWEVLPWHRSDGSIGGIVISSEDISERKAAEAENAANRAKLAAALDSMTDAVFIADTQGHFIDFNDAFVAFHRFRNKQECLRSFAEYSSIRELFLPSGAPLPVEQWPVQCALRGESGSNVEYGIRRTDTG